MPAKKFYGIHAPALAQMEWSGRVGDYEFESHAIGTSSSAAWGALIGVQRTGSFY